MHDVQQRRVDPPSVIAQVTTALLVFILLGALSVAGVAKAVANQPAAQAPPAAAYGPVRDIVAVGFTVADMDRSIAFYRDVLTFDVERDVEVAGEPWEKLTGVFGVRLRLVTMRLGEERLELTQFLTPRGRPIPIDSAGDDRWFQHVAIVTPDMRRAYEHLRRHKVAYVSPEPQRLPDWNVSAGGIEAFYFRDPDDHILEIIAFPADKGRPRWRELAASDPDRLFLGVDHTAIVVTDTDASLAFYGDLGLNVVGASENFGAEQAHLNNVAGARLRITSVRPSDAFGPSVEFLEYLAPTDGRPYPARSRANDLWHWETTVVVEDIDAGLMALEASDVAWVSDGVVGFSDRAHGFTRAAVLRDPDGHAIRLVAR
jgi:catechol 2,3-dioxygenase-like lactoylglutathione lyase family enzyme